MFSSLFSIVFLAAALSLKVSAHAGVTPALGVSGTFARSDVQRPSTASPCGAKANIAGTLDTSTPVIADANGQFTATVTNFNAGKDGSRQVSAKVDATGTGKSFSGSVSITQNGDLAPTNVGSQQIKGTLPAGTTCSGGTDQNLCLLSFTTASGFGNCVVVQQGGAASGSTNTGGNAAGAGASTNGTTASGAAAAGKAVASQKAKKGRGGKAKGKAAAQKKAQAANVGGTRAARALLNEETWLWS